MKSTIPLIARISHSRDFSCSQKTVLSEDFLYVSNYSRYNNVTDICLTIYIWLYMHGGEKMKYIPI